LPAPHVPPLSYLFPAVILSAAKDPEGLPSFTAVRLFPTRLSTVVSTIHPNKIAISTEAPHALLCATKRRIRYPIPPPHDEQKAMAATR
jgi:hypothetical protein